MDLGAGITNFDGGDDFRRARGREAWARSEEERRNGRETPPGAGYMRPPRGHRTLFMWHRTRPVTTGLMRREGCISASHRTMGTGRWL